MKKGTREGVAKGLVLTLSVALAVVLGGCGAAGDAFSEGDGAADFAADATANVADDPIVGYWKCLQWNMDGDTTDLSGNGRTYAEFRADGTWTLTLEDETYDNVWEPTEESDGIPYLVGLADQAWGGLISNDGPRVMLVIGSLDDPENTMVLQRVEE